MRALLFCFITFLSSCSFCWAESYSDCLNSVKKEISCFKSEYESFSNKDSVLLALGKYIEYQLVVNAFSYWEGTPWDFNGYTNVPKEGTIACGYFVSTTLRHVGFNLNRYKMAQQASMLEVKTLDSDYRYIDSGYGDFCSYAQDSLENGLYILGLSFHVGYLHKTDSTLNFIHSNYIEDKGVSKEKALGNEALIYSDVFALGRITNNKELLRKYIENQQIEVVLE